MPSDDRAKKPRVIIVDDDRDTREMLTLALELEGFDVGQAANGLRLISARKSVEDERAGIAAGAVDYFPKPLDMDRLVARIRQILDERAGAVPAPA